MEDNSGIGDDRQNGDSKDIMMTDADIGNEELAYPQETHHANRDLPFCNGEEAGNDEEYPVATADLHPETDFDHPDVRALEEEDSVEPSVVTSANELQCSPDLVDDTYMDPLMQSASPVPSETYLDADNGTEEEELNRGGAKMKIAPENETKGNGSNKESTLPSEDGVKEENLKAEVAGMELPTDTERKDKELHNVVTGTELPLYYARKGELNALVTEKEELADNEIKEELPKFELDAGDAAEFNSLNRSFLLGPDATESDESGSKEEQAAFMKELEIFHKQRCLDFKPPRFYGEPLNCLKLWRSVVRLGGYEQVTSCKLWRQVGESFKPPKTCTTVSWTFRCFYEKALLEYEKHKLRSGELPFTDGSFADPTSAVIPLDAQASGSGRARRDAAARAMQGWHSQRFLGNGEVGDPIIKDKSSTSTPKREKQLKSIGLLKRKKPSPVERAVKVAHMKASKPQSDAAVIDIGPPADWVKINVQRTKDCFEVYALVPGLLREEVRVQSDPVGRLVISGQPEQLDNPWGVTPFRKVVSLPSRIDPHQTSAVVTLHGQLFVRVPFEPLDL